MSAAATLRAAAGQVDLKPVVGSRLTGFASRPSPSTGCHDPLMGKVLLVDAGATRLAWIVCDLIGFSIADDAELRRLVAARLAIPSHHVLVSCTHTHSGPSSMSFRGTLAQVDRAWLGRTFNSIADQAALLGAKLRPAKLLHATEGVPGLGYNRQNEQSPIDERLVVAQLRADDGEAIATILNYATHPVVLGEQNLLFSADYPGYACRAVEAALGGVAMFVLGSAGDVDPVVYRDVGRSAGTFAVAEEMGTRLATAATRALRSTSSTADASLAVAQEQVEVPLAPPPSLAQLATMKDQLNPRGAGSDGRAEWSVFELAWADELQRAIERDAVPKSVVAHMMAVKMGELHAVTFPFEIYSRIGLDVRQHSATQPVIIAAYTNGLIGYAPTDVAIDEGGYGPSLSYRFFPQLLTPLAHGTHAQLARTAMKVLDWHR